MEYMEYIVPLMKKVGEWKNLFPRWRMSIVCVSAKSVGEEHQPKES